MVNLRDDQGNKSVSGILSLSDFVGFIIKLEIGHCYGFDHIL